VVLAKKGTTYPTSLTHDVALDEALCHGWIDGQVGHRDQSTYRQRFTPRRERSQWSARNVAIVSRLITQGRMQPAGREAFARRREVKTAIYSYEQDEASELSPEDHAQLAGNADAWAFFSQQTPSYQRVVVHWVVRAKRAETRARRLKALVDDSAAGLLVKHLRY